MYSQNDWMDSRNRRRGSAWWCGFQGQAHRPRGQKAAAAPTGAWLLLATRHWTPNAAPGLWGSWQLDRGMPSVAVSQWATSSLWRRPRWVSSPPPLPHTHCSLVEASSHLDASYCEANWFSAAEQGMCARKAYCRILWLQCTLLNTSFSVQERTTHSRNRCYKLAEKKNLHISNKTKLIPPWMKH